MKIIWLVNFAILFAFIKVFEIPSMIPVFVDELQISYAQAGLFMTAYTVVRCLASLPAGSVTDRLGAAPVISICLLCVGLLGMLGTVGDNYHVLLALRVLVSIGIAIIFIAAVDSIPKYMPPDQVGKGIGYINGSLNVGIALAMFMTPILADALGWRWTARIYSVAFVLLFIFSIPLLRNPPRTAAPDNPGSNDKSAGQPICTATAARRVASRDGCNEGSITIGALLRNPCVMLLAFSACILFVELYGVLTWVPVFLDEVYGYSPSEIGASATMFGIAAIPASIITGFLCTNLRRIVLLCVSGGILACTGILILLLAPHMPLWITAAVITMITWGHSQVIVTIMSVAAMIVPSHSSGKALGVIFTFGYAGSILGSYSGGYLLEITGQYDPSFFLFSASAITSIIAMLAVSRILHNNPPAHFKLI